MSSSRDSTARFDRAYNEVRRQFEAGHLSEARELVAALSAKFPGSLDAMKLGAAIASRAKDYRTAQRYIQKALTFEPDNPGLLAHFASSLASLRQYQDAIRVADQALVGDTKISHVFATLGSVYTQCGVHEKALHCFRNAAALTPDSHENQYNLGTSLRFAGDFSEAERCFDRVIELSPSDYEAYYARSGLRTVSDDHNHIADIEKTLAAGCPTWRGEVLLRYSLAKEFEDLGNWERSIQHLLRGAKLKRTNMKYNVAKDVEKMDQLWSSYTREKLESSNKGCASEEPIFVLGLPRSGSTLVERILASHSCVASAGELQNFAVELMRLVHARLNTTKLPIETIIRESFQLDFASLGKAYVDSTRHITGQTPYFIDKMPQNFLYIGLIHMALPNAKIIHVHRDAMDVCYAMLKTVFKGAYPFSYSLSDLGQYYAAYADLMKHWNACLPNRILNIRYEDMVLNQEEITRELLSFCGLHWEDSCLQFHKLDTVATTASAVEVRRPIYNSSVGKWKNYRRELRDLEDFLRSRQLV